MPQGYFAGMRKELVGEAVRAGGGASPPRSPAVDWLPAVTVSWGWAVPGCHVPGALYDGGHLRAFGSCGLVPPRVSGRKVLGLRPGMASPPHSCASLHTTHCGPGSSSVVNGFFFFFFLPTPWGGRCF